MSTELSAYRSIGADPASSLAFIDAMGKAFHQGGLAGCKSEGQGKAMALTCLCDNITPLQFMRTYHLMDGKPSMRSDAMLAAFMAAGGRWKWIEQGDDGKLASAEVSHGDNSLTVRYSIEDAKRAGLIKPKGGWETDPGAMLRARCISKAIRMVAPQIVAGVYTPEELNDLRADDVTATVVSSRSESESPAPAKKPKASAPKPEPATKQETPKPEQPAAEITKPAPVKGELVTEPSDDAAALKSKGDQMMAEAGESGAVSFPTTELRNEIQKIQAEFELTNDCYAWMAKRQITHINNITVQQARRLLVCLYVKGMGFTEKFATILQSQGFESLDTASEEFIEKALGDLRAKYTAGN